MPSQSREIDTLLGTCRNVFLTFDPPIAESTVGSWIEICCAFSSRESLMKSAETEKTTNIFGSWFSTNCVESGLQLQMFFSLSADGNNRLYTFFLGLLRFKSDDCSFKP